MVDKDLQTIMSSGDLTSGKLGGTDTGKIILVQDDLDAHEALSHDLLLFGFSTAVSQAPAALDTPIKIEFGAAQGTVSDPVMIDVNGKITFNETGSYHLIVALNYGRTGSTGTSVLFLRQLDDGAQLTTTLATKIDDANTLIPLFVTQVVDAVAGRTIEFEFYRDSAGANFGGLFQVVPTLAGWSTSPSAATAVFRA